MEHHPRLTFARDLDQLGGSRRREARLVLDGRAVRVARGAYSPVESWHESTPRARYLALIRAIAMTRATRPVLSHWSAAAVHDLPMDGDWPTLVHITQAPGAGARSRHAVIRHSTSLSGDEVEEIDGLLVTTLARTVVDIAATAETRRAIVMADAVLFHDADHGVHPRLRRDELLAAADSRGRFSGFRRARSVIDFAETQAATPIESVSRFTMHQLGCPRPQLQVAHYDRAGFIGNTDFAWPEFGVVGEADGRQKYLDERFRGGRSAEQVVYDEKLREDRLRALPRKVARWGWSVARDPRRLRAVLVAQGLPIAPFRR